MVRKQIVVPEEIDARIRLLAEQRGISQSAVIVEAVGRMPTAADQFERIMAFAGVIKGLPPTLSEEVDAVLYGG